MQGPPRAAAPWRPGLHSLLRVEMDLGRVVQGSEWLPTEPCGPMPVQLHLIGTVSDKPLHNVSATLPHTTCQDVVLCYSMACCQAA
jgi:hypothetical protein